MKQVFMYFLKIFRLSFYYLVQLPRTEISTYITLNQHDK